MIGFGIHAAGCLYAAYWGIFVASAAFVIISSYLRHPAQKPASHQLHQHHK
jgi:drug/metabolite transporter superfamily protein YnfA